MKDASKLTWVKVNEKYILIVGDTWAGSPIIACPVDILMISKHIKERYKECILPIALKNCRVIYLDTEKKGESKGG